jgi:chromosome segregation ATPase
MDEAFQKLVDSYLDCGHETQIAILTETLRRIGRLREENDKIKRDRKFYKDHLYQAERSLAELYAARQESETCLKYTREELRSTQEELKRAISAMAAQVARGETKTSSIKKGIKGGIEWDMEDGKP